MKKFWPLTNNRAGHLAEKGALIFLMLKGYRLVRMNYVVGRGTGAGEIDLIVKRGKTLVFVEVKKRPTQEQAAQAIRIKNQHRIRRASQVFLSRFPEYQDYHIRYDAVFIYPWKKPQHLVNAWTPFLMMIMLFLNGCQILPSALNVGHSVGVMVADDQPLSQDMRDIEIYTKVRQKLAEKDIKTLLDVQITVFGGRVLLTGALPNMEMIAICTETAWQVPFVQYVYNYIRLGATTGVVQSSQESFSAASIKTRLSLTEGIKSSNYKIVVENNVVYVMGLKQDEAEWEKARQVIKQTYGVERVVYLMSDL